MRQNRRIRAFTCSGLLLFWHLHFSKGPKDIFHHCPRGHSAEQKSGSRRISVMLKNVKEEKIDALVATVVYDLVAVSPTGSWYQTSYYMSAVKSWGRWFSPGCICTVYAGCAPAQRAPSGRRGRTESPLTECCWGGSRWKDEQMRGVMSVTGTVICDWGEAQHRTSGLYWNILNVSDSLKNHLKVTEFTKTLARCLV